MKYKHQSIYFQGEEEKLLDTLKKEAKKNHQTFSDYVKELVKLGQDKGVYNLPESTKTIDHSEEIRALQSKIETLRNDITRITALKDDLGLEDMLKVLQTDNYLTERQILQKSGKVKKSLFTDVYDEEHIELLISDLQAKLCLRAEYYKDIEYKQNQGWRKK